MPTILVKNIPYTSQKNDILQIFGRFGPVHRVVLVIGRGPKYALVDMATTADALAAINATKGLRMQRQHLRVEARFSTEATSQTLDGGAEPVRHDPLLPWCPWAKLSR